MIKDIAEHSLDTSLINGGWVLDVGCRGFDFSKEMIKMGCKVIAIDAGKNLGTPPTESNFHFENKAFINGEESSIRFSEWGNGTGSFVVTKSRQASSEGTTYEIEATNIRKIMDKYGIFFFDVVKMDCEGSEYNILLNWPGPISKQITVEFHDFLGINPFPNTDDFYKKMFGHIGQWYKTASHEKSKRYCLDYPNYWDSLFILKE